MIPRINYQKFTKLDDALKFLKEKGYEAKIIAGGTDLVVQLRARKLLPKYLVDIQSIGELHFIEETSSSLRIGALTTIEEMRRNEAVRKWAPPLWESAQVFATWQVRNIGTIGGNLCNASPAADTAPPLLVLGAEVRLKSMDDERRVPLEEFFTGPGETVMRPDELLTEVVVPKSGDGWGYGFEKLGRRLSHILSIVSASAAVRIENDKIKEVKVALGSVAPTPVRAKTVEKVLRGSTPSEETIQAASEQVVKDIKPISDVRASAEYRLEMSKILTRRVLLKALKEVISP